MSSSYLPLPGWGTIGPFVQQEDAQRVRSPPTWLSLSHSQEDTKAETSPCPYPLSLSLWHLPTKEGLVPLGEYEGPPTRKEVGAVGIGKGEEGLGWVHPREEGREKVPSLEGDPASRRSPGSPAAWPTKLVPNPKGKTKESDSRTPSSLLQHLTNRSLGKGAELKVSTGIALGGMLSQHPLHRGEVWGPGKPGGGVCPQSGRTAELLSQPESF